ncbi:hypothetical protein [Dyella acidisoli]|uniref:Uncharacterized protein n=1 Tax=Dyella acidisoli TaxID=1867834 RepID=A0ABQ5XP66_9GAMM|nr:hypothetical protein [Dyella acidisoli]GLQ93502.1 hypothetical protein GCM10007901_24530 [Dyella acidisoli]
MKWTISITASAFALLAGCTNPGIVKVSDKTPMSRNETPVVRPDVVIQNEKFPGPATLSREYTDVQTPKLKDLLSSTWLTRN